MRMRYTKIVLCCLLVLETFVHNASGQKPTTVSGTHFQQLMAKAKTGDAKAQFELGEMYDFGEGIEHNPVEAIRWYREAANKGYAPAQTRIGIAYGIGECVPKDYMESARWYRMAADRGDAEAQFYLGEYCEQGKGLPQNFVEAVQWYRKSANLGYTFAQVRLGRMCEEGKGVIQDYADAMKWYRQAADRNDSNGQIAVALMYQGGYGVAQDHFQALSWFRKASTNPIARFEVALLYETGKGVRQDYVEALKLFRLAADQNYRPACLRVGMMYAQGKGLAQDYAEALKWFRKAAEPNPHDKITFPWPYEGSNGVAKTYIEAYQWLSRAASVDSSATALRDFIATKMTSEQIAEGQRRPAPSAPLDTSTAQIQDQTPIAKAETRGVPPLPRQDSQFSVQSSGTGFFITGDGYLLTNFHVVDKASRIVVGVKQETYDAKVIATDAVNDVALLKVSGKFNALPMASSRTVRLGDPVFTVGYPNPEIQGVEPKLTRGEINSLAGIQDDPRHFQISVPVQPGNSGGPLVNQIGNVVGILKARLDDLKALESTGSLPQNVNYAVKSSFAIAFLETVPEVAAQLIQPTAGSGPGSEKIIRSTQDATALILVLSDDAPAPILNLASEIAASLNQNNYLKAERLSRESLEHDPEDVASLFFLGASLYRMGRLGEAMPLLHRAGFAAPRNENLFSCFAGRLLGLSHYANWLTTKAPADHHAASRLLQVTTDCPAYLVKDGGGRNPGGDTIAAFFASISSELANPQKEALIRLADITGRWAELDSTGQVKHANPRSPGEDYRLFIEPKGSAFKMLRVYKQLGVMYGEMVEGTLTKNGLQFVGRGKETIGYMNSSELEFTLVLELSQDFQYLKGIRTYLRCSGNKSTCQLIMDTSQNIVFQRR